MDRRQDLARRLSEHVTHDGLEQEHLSAMQALVGSDGDVMSRHHFEPGHFTASAFVLAPASDALLMIFHGKLHRWLQPGGHVDSDDRDIVAAARREVWEEVGIEPTVDAGILDVDVHEIPALRGEPAHLHLDVRFLMRARDRHFAAGSDAMRARWVRFDEFANLESDASVHRAVRRIQRLLGK